MMQETQSHAVWSPIQIFHTRLYEIFLGQSPYYLASNSKLLQTNYDCQGSFFILIGGLTIGLSGSNQTFLNVLLHCFGS